jgi:acyl carrier protein
VNKNEIINAVNDLLVRKFSISEESLTAESRSESLLGTAHNMGAIGLTYLFFELQREFNVKFAPHLLQDYNFMTIDGIVSAVEQSL